MRAALCFGLAFVLGGIAMQIGERILPSGFVIAGDQFAPGAAPRGALTGSNVNCPSGQCPGSACTPHQITLSDSRFTGLLSSPPSMSRSFAAAPDGQVVLAGASDEPVDKFVDRIPADLAIIESSEEDSQQTAAPPLQDVPPAQAVPHPLNRFEEEVRAVIEEELTNVPAEERQIWFEELRSLPAEVVRDLLSVRKQLPMLAERATGELDAIPPEQPAAPVIEFQAAPADGAPSLSSTAVSPETPFRTASTQSAPPITAPFALSTDARLAQRVIAHNLANVATPGFKRLRMHWVEDVAATEEAAGIATLIEPLTAPHEGIPSALQPANSRLSDAEDSGSIRSLFAFLTDRQPGDRAADATALISRLGGVRLAGVSVDLDQGTLVESPNRWDMAIRGQGWFVVLRSGKRFITRRGEFALNQQGQLSLRWLPDAVLDPPVAFDLATGGIQGELKLFFPVDHDRLMPVGDGLYSVDCPLVALSTSDTEEAIVGGSLEQSNVNPESEQREWNRLQQALLVTPASETTPMRLERTAQSPTELPR